MLCFRREKAPNYLATLVGSYFERFGFCFAVVPSVSSQKLVFHVHYQNRYQRSCEARIHIISRDRKDSELSKIINVTCEGGEFGVVAVPLAVPRDLSGLPHDWNVFCEPVHPNGRGRALFFREGAPVGLPTSEKAELTKTVVFALAGGVHVSKPAQFRMTLPQNVDDQLPSDSQETRKTLWLPGEPEIQRYKLPRLPTDE